MSPQTAMTSMIVVNQILFTANTNTYLLTYTMAAKLTLSSFVSQHFHFVNLCQFTAIFSCQYTTLSVSIQCLLLVFTTTGRQHTSKASSSFCTFSIWICQRNLSLTSKKISIFRIRMSVQFNMAYSNEILFHLCHRFYLVV